MSEYRVTFDSTVLWSGSDILDGGCTASIYMSLLGSDVYFETLESDGNWRTVTMEDDVIPFAKSDDPRINQERKLMLLSEYGEI